MTDQTGEQSLGLQTPFHEAAAAAARKAMDEIASNWAGALSGEDVEAIHDLRVGSRRLRAALSVYEHAFAPREFRRVERAISRLTDALGPARDADVLIEHIEAAVDALSASDEASKLGLRSFIEHLKQQRSLHQESLDQAMRKMDPAQILADLEMAAAAIQD